MTSGFSLMISVEKLFSCSSGDDIKNTRFWGSVRNKHVFTAGDLSTKHQFSLMMIKEKITFWSI